MTPYDNRGYGGGNHELILRPAAGAPAVVLWIGIFAIITGILQIGLGFRRSWGQLHPAGS